MKTALTLAFLISIFVVPAGAQVSGWTFLTQDGPTSIFQKFIKMGEVRYPVATVTHSVYKHKTKMSRADGMKEADRIAEYVRASVHQGPWKVVRSGDQVEFHADWEKQNRFAHILYRNFGDYYVISVSMIRRIYSPKSGPEAVSLQHYLAELNEPLPVRKTSSWLREHMQWAVLLTSQPLEAQGVPAVPPLVIDATGLNNAVSNFNASASANIDKLNAGLNNNAQTFNAGLSNGFQQFNSGLSANIDKMDGVITRASSMSSMFQSAFGAGMGSAAGSIVVSFVADNIVSIVSSLYHDLVGTFSDDEKARMNAVTKNAFDSLAKSSEKLTQLETDLDKRIVALSLLGGGDTEDLAGRVDHAIEQAKIWKAENSHCDVTGKGTFYVLSTLSQWMTGPENNRQAICQKINELLMEWPSTEAQIYNAQQTIRHNADVIIAGIQNSYLSSASLMDSRKGGNLCTGSLDDMKDSVDDAGPNIQCIKQNYEDAGYNPNGVRVDEKYEKRITNYCLTVGENATNKSVNMMRDLCDKANKSATESNESVERAHGRDLAAASVEAVSAKILNIQRADCAEGQHDSVCDGHAGSFDQMRDRYNALYAKAQQQCPNTKLFKPTTFAAPTSFVNSNIRPGALKKRDSGGLFGWL